MAYSYKQTMDSDSYGDGGYINFNISPVLDSILGVGDVLTISGQAYWKTIAIKSIEVSLDMIGIGFVNKSIAKATAGTFSIQITFTQELVNRLCRNSAGNITTRQLNFTVWDTANCGGGGSYTNVVSSHRYRILPNRVAPTIESVVISDQHPVLVNSQTPYEYFGEFVQGESLPCITVAFATDSRDPKLTTTHHLVITDSGDNVVYDVSALSDALATSATIQLPAFQDAGTYNAAWTVTDSAGLTASTYTDTFTVAAYTPPTITALDLVRFATTLSGDIQSDDGENLWLTLAGTVAPLNSLNAYSVTLSYSHDGGTETTVPVTSDTDGSAFSIAEDDTTPTADTVLYGEVFDALYNYDITLTVQDMLHTVQGTFVVLKAGGFMNVEKYGVAIGKRTTATPTDKRFEVAQDYTSHFGGEVFAEGGIHIDWVDLTVASGITNPSANQTDARRLQVGKIGNRAYIRGVVDVAGASGSVTIAALPQGYIPLHGCIFAATGMGARIARLAVQSDGYLVLMAIYNISDGARYTTKNYLYCDCAYWLD